MAQAENADQTEEVDQNMTDADGPVKISTKKQRVHLLPGSTPAGASFQFDDEDHTLGNALRYMIMKNPEVEFCGYSIPHPSEAKMNIRIQTYEPYTPHEALRKGLTDLEALCTVVEEKFTEERDRFNASQGKK